MTAFDPALLLSAQRALLGAIDADVRLISVRRDDAMITMTTVSARPLSDAAAEALSIAATEIIADFPDCAIREQFVVSDVVPFQRDGVGEYRVFQRLEVSQRPVAAGLPEAAHRGGLDDLRLDREHVAHLLYECRDGRHPATQENEADLQRELEELDAKIAHLPYQA